MSTETTKKKIKIDNGTTFGRTYTDKAIDAKLPTDLIATANKLSLGVGNSALGNGVNLNGFTYDEATNTLKVNGGGSGDSIPILDITLDEDNPMPLTDAQVNLLQANDGKLVIININFKADGTSLQATPTLAYILTSGPIIEFGGFKALICAGYFPYFNSINNFAWSNTYIYVNNDNTFSFVSNGFKIPNETEAGKVLMVSDSNYQDGAGKMIWSYEFKTISLFGKYSILVPYYNNSTVTNIDLYIHNIVLKDTADTPTKKIYLTIQSTANTPATTKELLQTLLGSTARYIRVSGYTPTNDISAINWTGTFDTSKYDVRGTETLLTDFTVIEDSVVTL